MFAKLGYKNGFSTFKRNIIKELSREGSFGTWKPR